MSLFIICNVAAVNYCEVVRVVLVVVVLFLAVILVSSCSVVRVVDHEDDSFGRHHPTLLFPFGCDVAVADDHHYYSFLIWAKNSHRYWIFSSEEHFSSTEEHHDDPNLCHWVARESSCFDGPSSCCCWEDQQAL